MSRVDYTGEIIGTRQIIKNFCDEKDWENSKLLISEDRKPLYRLGKCLNCGATMPVDIKLLKRNPPKRCCFCSGIGNKSEKSVARNSWTCHDEYAVVNIPYHDEIVSVYISLEDYDLSKQYTWRISQKRNKYYAVTGKSPNLIYLHQLIYGPVGKNNQVDHKDGNSLNNRRTNLRELSSSDNQRNVQARIDNQIGIRGVSFCKRDKMYKVDFSFDHKRFYVKSFNTVEEAVWCRYCFEKHFNLTQLNYNPLFEQYNTLSSLQKNEIEIYVRSIISKT